MRNRIVRSLAPLAAILFSAAAPSPTDPVVHYVLHVDSATNSFNVEMRIHSAPDSFRIAMNAHPEYDDKYWRYLTDLRVDCPQAGGSVARADSSLWRVTMPGGEGTIRYRIALPRPEPTPRNAWKPFLAPTGALTGGPHSFLYLVGHERISSAVTLDLPAGWNVATELEPTSDPRTYYARSVEALMEGAIFAGTFSDWRFAVDGVPHRVIYWRAPNAPAFDTTTFVKGIKGVVEQAVGLFGHAPWREYTFVFQDSAWGGLEHPNSVTLGAPSTDLARDPNAYLMETAHEFFHSWNLMRIRPMEYRSVDWKPQPPTAGLWFSEGLTMLYADLNIRRSGGVRPDTARAGHLASMIARYTNSPGHSRLSAERVSRAAYNAQPDALGDYTASTHLQGEVIGAMLDLIIRDATDGRSTIDDVMRHMDRQFTGAQTGFTGADVERAVEAVCRCDVTPFFDAHVRNGTPIDFNRYLGLIGLHASVANQPARGRDGSAVVDAGVWAYVSPEDNTLRLHLSSPDNAWGRLGYHTGDRVFAVNGQAVGTWPEFRTYLARFRVGDSLRIDAVRGGRREVVTVVGTQLTQAVVTVEPIPGASERAVRLRRAWASGR